MIVNSFKTYKVIYKVAKEFENKKLALKMGGPSSTYAFIKDVSTALKLPLDKVPLFIPIEKLPLIDRYHIRRQKARNRVQYFSKFIEKFHD